MTSFYKVDHKGVWIALLCFFISGLAVLPEGPYRLWVQHLLGVPQTGDSAMRFLRKEVATRLQFMKSDTCRQKMGRSRLQNGIFSAGTWTKPKSPGI
jgi:hypothetical protein